MGYNKIKFGEHEIVDIIDRYVNKLEPIYKIGKQYGVDSSTIRKRLVENGVIIISGSPYNAKYWMERGMDETEAREHIKTLRPTNIKYWLNLGYTEEESKKQIEGQKYTSLRGCQARFGDAEGERIWNDRANLRTKWGSMGSTNIDYWINLGYSESDALIKRSERQKTFSLDICVEKYGGEKGVEIFNNRQKKWINSLNKNGGMKNGFSKISQELFKSITIELGEVAGDNIRYGSHNGEYVLERGDSGVFSYDFTDLVNKKIIEYHGDLFHGNPNKYKSTDTPNPFNNTITAQNMWDTDKIKQELAESYGFKVLIIWDSEYRADKNKVIKQCFNFLNYD